MPRRTKPPIPTPSTTQHDPTQPATAPAAPPRVTCTTRRAPDPAAVAFLVAARDDAANKQHTNTQWPGARCAWCGGAGEGGALGRIAPDLHGRCLDELVQLALLEVVNGPRASTASIAAALGRDPSTVRAWLRRGLRKLQLANQGAAICRRCNGTGGRRTAPCKPCAGTGGVWRSAACGKPCAQPCEQCGGQLRNAHA